MSAGTRWSVQSRRTTALLACVALLSACAATKSDWSAVEGCWTDGSDAIPPASMIWRADPARPGAYLGAWRVPEPAADAVDFDLAPNGDEMRVCERAGDAEQCARAVLDRGDAGDVVFTADETRLLFGHAEAPAPFFWGTRRPC